MDRRVGVSRDDENSPARGAATPRGRGTFVLAYKCPFRASYLHVFACRAACRPAGGGLLS